MSEEEQNFKAPIALSNSSYCIRGFSFPALKQFTRKNCEDAMDFVPGDGDLIIASFPKTGTTWLQYIVLQITSKGQLFPSFDEATHKLVPYIEMVGVEAVIAQGKPRVYKHHIAYNKVQKNDKSKCIYIYRNPEDTVVSFYHFLRNLDAVSKLDFNVFFEIFVRGKIPYGNYFRHALSFYEHREDENLLMVSYEKLQANKREEILKIAKFLGEEYYKCLLQDEQLFNNIIHHTSFDYMKQNFSFSHPDITAGVRECPSKAKAPKVEFFRKGIVGDGKTVLTETQRRRLKAAAEEVLEGTSIIDEWYPE